MVIRRIVAFIAVAVALGSGTVQAADQGGYFGIGLGQSTAKDVCSSLTSLGADSCDDKDTGVKLFGGYQFNPNGAIELGYVDLGKVKATGSGASLEFKAKGFDLAFVGTLPIDDQFSILARVGLFLWNVDTSVTGGFSDSSSGNDLTYGLGVKYDFSKKVSVRFEWQQFKGVGDDGVISTSDVNLLYAGMVFGFN